jgi:hypothetical protein
LLPLSHSLLHEEEVMRNTLNLANQLRSVKDPDHMMISFHAQTRLHLHFTVILIRLLKGKELPLMPPLPLIVEGMEIKQLGTLKNRYPKEATIYNIALPKTPFIRPDFVIDLLKARRVVAHCFTQSVPMVRDFNGGLLLKQQETFQQLKTLVGTTQELLLEDFFYSLKPPLQQTLLPPADLKILFSLLQEALHYSYEEAPYFLASSEGTHVILLAASPSEEICSALKILPPPVCATYTLAQGIHCLGSLYLKSQAPPLESVHVVLKIINRL